MVLLLVELLQAPHVHDGMNPVAAADAVTGPPAVAEIPAHNSHPMVESITLKGDNTRGTIAAVTADVATTTDVMENQFTLVVKFDQPVVGAADVRTLATDSADLTATPIVLRDPLVGADPASPSTLTNDTVTIGDFTVSIVNGDSTSASADTRIAVGAAAATGITAGIATRTGTAGDTFEVVVTLTDTDATNTDNPFPSGIMGADTRIFKVQVNANAVYSLETAPTNAIGDITGSGSTASRVYPFTLVDELPRLADTVAPTVDIAVSDALVSGKAVFTLTFSEGLGSGVDKLDYPGDFTVSNGTIAAMATDFVGADETDASTEEDVYVVHVTPNTGYEDGPITLTIVPEAQIADPGTVSNNPLRLDRANSTLSATFDLVRPTVLSHSVDDDIATPTGGDATATYLGFSFTFSEAIDPASFTVNALDSNVGDNAGINLNWFGPTPAMDDPLTANVDESETTFTVVVEG